jgi:hypothetical protein
MLCLFCDYNNIKYNSYEYWKASHITLWTVHMNVITLLIFSVERFSCTIINMLCNTNFQCLITLHFQQNLDIMDNDTLFRSYLMPGHRVYFISHGFLENGYKEWIKVSLLYFISLYVREASDALIIMHFSNLNTVSNKSLSCIKHSSRKITIL